MRAVLVLGLLAGCAGAAPVDPATTPAGTARCEPMADHLLALLRPAGAEPAASGAIRAAFRDRCVADGWTLDAERCFTALAAIDHADRCATLLTIAQRDGFQQAIEAALK
ncbi:MAG: hypothetical protein NT062_35370 [Proteobacteria bacterium]|nr:hypothetical protein [Pseudomonadota bacterium]